MINIEKNYSESIEKLKSDESISIILSDSDILELINSLQTALDKNDWKLLKKIIFHFQYTNQKCFILGEHLDRALLIESIPNELIIYILALYDKHILTPLKLDGLRTPQTTMTALNHIGKNTSPEVFEWFLRTIENLPTNDLRKFKDLITSKKPNLIQMIKKNSRTNNELIEYILNKL